MFREIKLEDFPEEISDYSTEKNDDIPFYIKAIQELLCFIYQYPIIL
jgi:hypothetical protein